MKKTIKSLFAIAIAAFAFTACSDVPEPDGYSPNTGDKVFEFNPTGSGTKADPYTTADAIAYAKSLNQQESTNSVYIKGKIVAVTESFTTNYGNATFTISDDGTAAGEVFTAYRVYYLGNKRYTANDTQIQPGDDVIVYGKVVNYKGNTPETVQGTAFLYSLNGVYIDVDDEDGDGEFNPIGSGTKEDPYTTADAIAYAKSLNQQESTNSVYIKGKVAAITESFTTNYGNATFSMSDDGTATGELFTAYRVYYLGNKRYTANDTQIQVGDEVIVYGKVVNYKGNTPETVQGTAYLYSLNGVTVDTGDEGDTAEPKGTGTVTDPFNVAAAIAKCEEVGTAGSTETYYIRGKVGSITEQFSAQFGNGTFTMVDEGYSAVFTAYRVKYLGNRSWKGGDTQIKVGDEVIVCGKVVNYYGNTPETVQGDSYLYSLNGVTEGGSSSGGEDQGDQGGNSEIIRSVNGTTLTLTNPSVTASTSKVTIDFTALGWTHQQENPSASANDVSVAFSVGDGGTTPKYWNTGNYDEIRVYAKNIFTITGSKPIAKIVATCTQTSYVGNDTMTGTVSGNTWTIINDHTSTSGGTQLRMKSIEITYAQ